MGDLQPFGARSLLWLLILLCVAPLRPTTAALDYLAPIPAGSATPCQDTAPDCMDVCGCDETGIDFACKLSSPIGEYLRRVPLFLHVGYFLCSKSCLLLTCLSDCRANCKKTCGICGPVAPAPSQPFQLPTPYGYPNAAYACTDVAPPLSPYSCTQQVCNRLL